MAENMAKKLDYGVTGSIDVSMEKMSAEQYELALINTYKNLIEMGIDSQDALGILVKANVKKLADDVIAATKGDKDNAEAYKNIAGQATKYILSLLYHVPGTIEAEKAGDYKYLIGNGMLMAGVIEGEDFAKYLGTDAASPYKEKANGKKSKPEAVKEIPKEEVKPLVEPVKTPEPEIKEEHKTGGPENITKIETTTQITADPSTTTSVPLALGGKTPKYQFSGRQTQIF